MNKVEHLYIHIPFCNHICWYCDFKRSIENNNIKKQYVNLLISKLQNEYKDNKFKTVYIGGGTPNSLKEDLYPLLEELSKHLQKDCEYTIECNPESVNSNQVKVFLKYGVNRISLGVQSTNDEVLKKIGRRHTISDVVNSIDCFRKNNLENFSIDLIYGFNEQSIQDIKSDLDFVSKYKIPHVSFYSLEVKNNSVFGKCNYKLNEERVEEMLKVIEESFEALNYERYEISNWAKEPKFESKHNLAYWNSRDWIGLGYGAFGFENKVYYEICGSNLKWQKKEHHLSNEEYYQQIWIMGLRTKYGLDLNDTNHKLAFEYYSNKVNKKELNIKKDKVTIKNMNTLDNVLIQII